MDEKDFNNSLKLLARSSIIVFLAIFLSKGLNYAYRIIIARNFGPEVYGFLALSIVIVGWFRIFSEIGMPKGILRYISYFRGDNNKGNERFVFRSGISLVIVLSLIFGLILFSISDFLALTVFNDSGLSIFLKIFSIYIPAVGISGMLISTLKAHEKIGTSVFLKEILEGSMKVGILIFLIVLGFNALSVPYSFVAATVISMGAAFIVCKVKFPGLFRRSKLEKSKKKRIWSDLFSYSWPLMFFGLAMSLLHWTDSFVIGIFEPSESVGFYNAAVPLALLLVVSKDIFERLFFPLVTKEYSKGNLEVVKQLSQQIGKWIFIIVMPLFILMMFFPGVFINVLFGREYLVAETALRLLAIGALFTSLFDISKEIISMKGKSKTILVDVVIVAGINLVLNILLVPAFGINGAAFATMSSLILLNGLFVWQSYRYTGIIPVRRKLVRVSFAALISAGVLFVTSNYINVNLLWFIILGLMFGAIYLALLLITKSFDRNDKFIMKTIKNKFSIK